MKILFICKYNAFRSRISEEYFKKINRDKSIKVISRGLIMAGKPDPEQVQIPKELLGITINKRKPLPVTKDELKEADMIIITADDIPKIIFNYHSGILMKKIRVWPIKDEHHANIKNIKRITLEIKERIDKLNEELKRK